MSLVLEVLTRLRPTVRFRWNYLVAGKFPIVISATTIPDTSFVIGLPIGDIGQRTFDMDVLH